jgi:hypothetical protein
MNDLSYLGFGGGVLARLKGERRQALQGNVPFVIFTDLNLGNNKKQQIIINICDGFVVYTLHGERTPVRSGSNFRCG